MGVGVVAHSQTTTICCYPEFELRVCFVRDVTKETRPNVYGLSNVKASMLTPDPVDSSDGRGNALNVRDREGERRPESRHASCLIAALHSSGQEAGR